MAIGSYQSERAAENYKTGPKRMEMFIGALTMLIAYFIAGMLVLVPYFVKRTGRALLPISVIISLILLFIAGWTTAYYTDFSTWLNAFETAALGLIAVGIGYVSGKIAL